MANKILIVFIVFDLLFLCCGVLHLALPLITRASQSHPPTVHFVAQNILLNTTPLTESMIISFIIFTAFILSLPAIVLPKSKISRHLLTAHAYLASFAAFFTLVLGLIIWFSTLQIKAGLLPIWNKQDSTTQSLLQQKFNCCGYLDSAVFVKDSTCSSVGKAAQLGPCEAPFSLFADQFLAIVFTAFFGIVAVDCLLLLSGLCLIKDRSEEVRYRAIDQKVRYGRI